MYSGELSCTVYVLACNISRTSQPVRSKNDLPHVVIELKLSDDRPLSCTLKGGGGGGGGYSAGSSDQCWHHVLLSQL